MLLRVFVFISVLFSADAIAIAVAVAVVGKGHVSGKITNITSISSGLLVRINANEEKIIGVRSLAS
ncbi:hypothetical protein SAMN04487870_0968 [Pseudoalteromonas sp. DSM 26666]|uniref:hypothetical protein n=1 Tax=Pseudoalteromonas sp. DSM 26666 TaxID=1761892 RepID=UPI0008E6ECB9|nr:hypothetical protein [Pseudoalteromonas sp. DSM 26666]SFT59293.1 hypothetical protein SAMN04487870_0968 [Pseudoalteromonas sp. DSM 26666]